MMFMHLPDLDSPKVVVYLPNPFYVEYHDPSSCFVVSLEDLMRMGDIFCPTYPMELESLALCGAELVHRPKLYPDLLWECVNYTLPCRIGTKPICKECFELHVAARSARKVS